MRKGIILWALVLALFSGLPAASVDPPNINIIAPAGGAILYAGTPCTIKWTHSSFFTAHPTYTCAVFCGSNIIASHIPVIQDQFVWTVGKKADATNIPVGTYEITIESDDYDELSGPNVQIKPLPAPFIDVTQPPDHVSLTIGTNTTIRWTHSAYYDAYPAMTCAVYCGSFKISPAIPVIKDQFVWKVGKKADMSNIPPGSYEITIESDDYDELGGPNVRLILSKRPPIIK